MSEVSFDILQLFFKGLDFFVSFRSSLFGYCQVVFPGYFSVGSGFFINFYFEGLIKNVDDFFGVNSCLV